jgi:UDP-N-acetyl-D-galactosamine dehydrogenase
MKYSLCIVGLGYVGLPLAAAFAREGFETYGFDISEKRIQELQAGHDRTRELTDEQLQSVKITYSADPSIIGKADIVIVAVPTPVDDNNLPDLSLVESASETVGKHMKKGCIVVYESTVYPGVTEELCGPVLENASGMKCGVDFTLGYSPERINPGDKEHTVDKIVKVVAGQDEKTLDTLCEVYGAVVKAGVHRAANIKVAEMAKAIENAQRDINIAFVNEIALLCEKIGIRSKDVLAAAGTKWNFLKFQPGLVGGHCIGVDPYYLVEKAKQLGMDTQVITAGRGINDSMSKHVANQVAKALGTPDGKRILVLGVTFKENIPDTRNSKAVDVVTHLQNEGFQVEVEDAEVEKSDLERMKLIPATRSAPYDALLLLVAHDAYKKEGTEALLKQVKSGGIVFDLKSVLDEEKVKSAGRVYLSL